MQHLVALHQVQTLRYTSMHLQMALTCSFNQEEEIHADFVARVAAQLGEAFSMPFIAPLGELCLAVFVRDTIAQYVGNFTTQAVVRSQAKPVRKGTVSFVPVACSYCCKVVPLLLKPCHTKLHSKLILSLGGVCVTLSMGSTQLRFYCLHLAAHLGIV